MFDCVLLIIVMLALFRHTFLSIITSMIVSVYHLYPYALHVPLFSSMISISVIP
jgi:hypothetical protein